MSDTSNAIDVQNADEDDQSKAVMLFGRDIRKIPCFKQSMLNGIYSGFAAGLATFMFTSRVKLSTNVALGSYMGVVVIYWCCCRYKHVRQKYEIQDLQHVIRQNSIGSVRRDEKDVQEPQGQLVDT